MKKLLTGLLVLASFSSFAVEKTCQRVDKIEVVKKKNKIFYNIQQIDGSTVSQRSIPKTKEESLLNEYIELSKTALHMSLPVCIEYWDNNNDKQLDEGDNVISLSLKY